MIFFVGIILELMHYILGRVKMIKVKMKNWIVQNFEPSKICQICLFARQKIQDVSS